MQRQRLEQKLLQKLSPQQIQLIKLLQLPVIELEQRIKQEVEENPALSLDEQDIQADEFEDFYEETEGENVSAPYSENTESQTESDQTAIEEIEQLPVDEILETDRDDMSFSSLTELYNVDEFDDYSYSMYVTSEEQPQIPYASGATFRDYLNEQLGLQNLDERQRKIGDLIIGNLDAAGYLSVEIHKIVDDLAIFYNISTTEEEVEDILRLIQTFDPPGIAARNLQEALLLQLERMPQQDDVLLAQTIIKHHFEEFKKKHYEKIIKKLEISEEKFKAALQIILKLNPKPGSALSETNRTDIYVIPDFIVTIENGKIELNVNQSTIPELKFNRSYIEMVNDLSKNFDKLNEQQKQTLVYLKQKIDSAKWFIDAIKQRHNTLYNTMKAIIEFQKDYFETGDETKLRPMILKDIAEKVNLDVSTISRVVNSKYVQTPYGTFLLKYFFSEGIATQEGDEASSREIKKIIQEIIENENKLKPLTDEQIVEILQQKGYNIARRTVAKYREQMEIPIARLRKEL